MPEINPVALPGRGRTPGDGNLYVRFINVGQGDCTYIIFPNGKRMLIDAGSVNASDLVDDDYSEDYDYFNYVSKKYRETYTYVEVDVLVLTHGDQDHYNLLFDRLGSSPIQWVYYGGNLSNDFTLYSFRKWLYDGYANFQHQPQQLQVNAASPNIKMLVDGSVAGRPASAAYAIAGCVAPTSTQDNGYRKNTNSIVTKITYGTDAAMVCGDATVDTETFMLSRRGVGGNPANYLATQNLLMPHHGSNTSSSPAFVAATNPGYVVVSAKDGNRFGLPRATPVNRWSTSVAMLAEPAQPRHWIGTYRDTGGYDPIQTTRNIWQTGITGSLTISMDGT